MLQHPQFTLTILDPASLLGRETGAALWRAFPAARRKLFHTSGADEHLISEFGGEAMLVPPLGTAGELDGSDIVVATATPSAAAAANVVSWLRANPAVFLIDCTQPGLAPAESLPVLCAPPHGKAELRWFHLADPALWAPGRILQSLASLDPSEVLLTVLLPVSDFGVAGVEELAKQAAARLSGRPPGRPESLPEVLAFDAAPATSARRAALEDQLRTLFPGLTAHLTAVQVGIFHGHAAVLALRADAGANAATVAALIRQSPGVRLARRNEHPQPSGAVDSDEILCAQLHHDGGWVTLWLVADSMRVGGAQVVADIVAAVRAS